MSCPSSESSCKMLKPAIRQADSPLSSSASAFASSASSACLSLCLFVSFELQLAKINHSTSTCCFTTVHILLCLARFCLVLKGVAAERWKQPSGKLMSLCLLQLVLFLFMFFIFTLRPLPSIAHHFKLCTCCVLFAFLCCILTSHRSALTAREHKHTT